MSERPSNSSSPVYDRTLLLHGSKCNEMLTLAEIEQYGLDSFGDADYVSIYGMPPREWYRHGIRLLGRTAVECTRDKFGKRIGLDVASVAARMPSNQWVVIDPFAGSCNTLFGFRASYQIQRASPSNPTRRSSNSRIAISRSLIQGSNLSMAITRGCLRSAACRRIEASSPSLQLRAVPP